MNFKPDSCVSKSFFFLFLSLSDCEKVVEMSKTKSIFFFSINHFSRQLETCFLFFRIVKEFVLFLSFLFIENQFKSANEQNFQKRIHFVAFIHSFIISVKSALLFSMSSIFLKVAIALSFSFQIRSLDLSSNSLFLGCSCFFAPL